MFFTMLMFFSLVFVLGAFYYNAHSFVNERHNFVLGIGLPSSAFDDNGYTELKQLYYKKLKRVFISALVLGSLMIVFSLLPCTSNYVSFVIGIFMIVMLIAQIWHSASVERKFYCWYGNTAYHIDFALYVNPSLLFKK